jgi:hypothetical protein
VGGDNFLSKAHLPITFLSKNSRIKTAGNTTHIWSYEEDKDLFDSVFPATNISSFEQLDNCIDSAVKALTVRNRTSDQIRLRARQLVCSRHPARIRLEIGPNIHEYFSCFQPNSEPESSNFTDDLKSSKGSRKGLAQKDLTDEQKQILDFDPFASASPSCVLITAAAGPRPCFRHYSSDFHHILSHHSISLHVFPYLCREQERAKPQRCRRSPGY